MEQSTENLLLELRDRLDKKAYFGALRLMILIASFEIYMMWLSICIGHCDLLRFSLIPLVIALLVFPIITIYIKNIYRLKDRSSILYIFSTLFGFFPQYIVKGEDFSPTKTGKEELIKTIGGPAYLYIDPPFVLLVRRSDGKFEIEGPGLVTLSKLEKVILIADRRAHSFRKQKIKSYTKDGILVTLSDVDFQYRIWAKSDPAYRFREGMEDGEKIYPYDLNALKRRGLDLNVGEDGKTNWHANVQLFIKNEMIDYFERHHLDDLMEPSEYGVDPRKIVYQNLDGEKFRQRLKNIGALLEFRDIGHITLPEDVTKKRQKAWQIKQNAMAELTRAQGEAEKVVYAEIGRSEGYETQLGVIKRVLEEIDLPDGDHKQNTTNLFMALSTQIFDELGARHKAEGNHKGPDSEN